EGGGCGGVDGRRQGGGRGGGGAWGPRCNRLRHDEGANALGGRRVGRGEPRGGDGRPAGSRRRMSVSDGFSRPSARAYTRTVRRRWEHELATLVELPSVSVDPARARDFRPTAPPPPPPTPSPPRHAPPTPP